MKAPRLSRRALVVGLGIAVAASGVGVMSYSGPAGAVTFTNVCIYDAAPTFAARLDVSLSGNVPAAVLPGASFQLTGITQTITTPGSVFVGGYNLGVPGLAVGVNTFPGTVKTVIEGTNTIEGTQTTPARAFSVTVTITDPDGVRNTGDETATDTTVTVTYPDQTWTAGPAGAIEFREDTVTPLSPTVGGILETLGGPPFVPGRRRLQPRHPRRQRTRHRHHPHRSRTILRVDGVEQRLLVGRDRRRDLLVRRRGVPRLDGSIDAQQADRRDGLNSVRPGLLVGRVRRRDLLVR